MLFEQTQTHLQALRLKGMLQTLQLQTEDPAVQDLSFDERFAMLVDAEVHDRRQRRQERLLRQAKLKVTDACVEDINYQAARGLKKHQIAKLSSNRWLQDCQHVLLTGPTGVGKTWLACALAFQAIRQGLSVRYYRLSQMLEESETAGIEGLFSRFRNRQSKKRLLVLDDWGLVPLSARNRHDLLELVEDRTGAGSFIITSQLPVEEWHQAIGDPTLADAILDRIIHRAHRIPLHGESLRKQQSLGGEQ